MARKPTNINHSYFLLLKQFIKAKSDLNCDRISDIQQLKFKIKKNIGENLSLQTLSRVFGIISDGFNPSVQTLDTLAKYVDYNSFDELGRLNPTGDASDIHSSQISKFIKTVFSNIKPDANIEPGLLQIIKKIIYLMLEDPKLTAEVYYSNAKHDFGRKYFFEQFVNMDGLDNVYGEGLKYYLLNAHLEKERFFVYIMYCYKYFLVSDIEMFKWYFNLLNEFKYLDIIAFHPMFIDRYYAVHVLNQCVEKRNINLEKNCKDSIVDFDMFSSHPESLYCAGYLVGEALVLAGEYNKAWDILNSDKIKPTTLPACMQYEFVIQLNILKLVSGYFSGQINHNKALQLYSELVNKPLSILVRNFYSFFLLAIKQELDVKCNGSINVEKEQLIKNTGFIFFKDYNLETLKENQLEFK